MRKVHFWRWMGVAALVALIAVFAVVLRGTPQLARAIRDARAADRHVDAAVELWRTTGPRGAARIEAELAFARRALTRSQETMESLTYLGVIPGVREVLAFGERAAAGTASIVDGAATLASTAAEYQRFLDRYADRSPADLRDAERAELLAVIGSSLASARVALDDFALGEATLAILECPRLFASVVEICRTRSLLRHREELERVRDAVRSTIDAAEHAVVLLGGRAPTSVLLLFLNNTELRPGGGFLGTYGLATVRAGSLVEFRTDDVYNLDRFVEGAQRIPPPEPLRRHGIVSWWYLRDANWSPDFRASSQTVMEFYRRERGPGDPSVVVGFTPNVASAFLRIVGPVTIGGKPYTSENIVDELEYQVEKGYDEQGIPRPQRKAIIEPLSRTVIDRILRMPFREWGTVVGALRTVAAERHLLAYSSDPALQAFFEQFNLAGRVRPLPEGSDGLLVVDANLGALKTDPMVERSIRYAIIPDGAGGYRGTIRLQYRNTGTFTWKTTRYRTYTRVYVPTGTELIRSSGAMLRDRSNAEGPVDRGEEFDRAWFGAFLSVEPGQERSLAFEIHLAPTVAERIRKGSYRLDVQKQLGSQATPLTLDLEFGTPVESADPPEPPAAWGNSRYSVETDIREDRVFLVDLKP